MWRFGLDVVLDAVLLPGLNFFSYNDPTQIITIIT